MIAVAGGLGTAVLFAVTTLSSSRGSRLVAPPSFLAGVMLVGLVVMTPWVAAAGVPDTLDRRAAGWLAVSGIGNATGLLFAYSALRIGKIGLVAPILSTEGAIAAVISISAGEDLTTAVGATLAVIAVGILLAAVSDDGDGAVAQRIGRAVLLATVAALAFGVSLYATGHVSGELPVAWVVLPARVVGVAAVAVPLALSSRLRLTRASVPFVLVSGAGEVAGFGVFAVAARHGLAVSAVLASQFAAISALFAFLLFGERLARVQVAGVATILAGVGVLSGLQS
jgi:uncharacterized membrane protein